MFDLSKLFSGGAGGGLQNMFSKPQGWGATVTPTDSLLSRDAATGAITGLNGDGLRGAFARGLKGASAGVGKDLGGFATGMEAGAPTPPPVAPPMTEEAAGDPNVANAQAYYQLMQARRAQRGY